MNEFQERLSAKMLENPLVIEIELPPLNRRRRTMITDKEILAKANPQLCQNRELQLAHDRMLLCKALVGSKEYSRRWRNYLAAGGDRTMRDNGIDCDSWRLLRATQ